jgi:hypothetical protein
MMTSSKSSKSQPVHNYHCIGLLSSHLGLLNSDPKEVAKKKMVGASQRMVTFNSQREQEGMSPALMRRLKLQIKRCKMRLEIQTSWKGS